MEGRGNLDLAVTLRMLGDIEGALAAASKALDVADVLEDEEACGECNTRMGSIHLSAGRAALAVPHLETAAGVWGRNCDAAHAALVSRRAAANSTSDELHVVNVDDPCRVGTMDDHADTALLLMQARRALVPSEPLAALLAAETGRACTLRDLLAFDMPLANDGPTAAPALASADELADGGGLAPPRQVDPAGRGARGCHDRRHRGELAAHGRRRGGGGGRGGG